MTRLLTKSWKVVLEVQSRGAVAGREQEARLEGIKVFLWRAVA